MKPEDFKAQGALEHLKKLAQGIGSRLSGTRGELEAAEYIRQQFKVFGFETYVQELKFTDVVWVNRLTTSAFIGVFVAALFLPPIHSLVVLVGFLILRGLAPKLAPKAITRNVIGKLHQGEAKPRLLITAHYDTSFNVIRRKLNSALSWLMLWIAALFVTALILRLFMVPPGGWQAYWMGLAIFLLPLQAWSLFTTGSRRGAPGANDNASGVAVMLETARVLSKSPPDLEVWFVAFGGEEQGLVGSKGLVEENLGLLKRARVLNLDMVGVGEPCITTGSGILRNRFKTSPTANRVLARAFKKLGHKVRRDWIPFATHDHLPFIRKSIPATTLTAGEVGTDWLARLVCWFTKLPAGAFKRYPYSHTGNDILGEIQPGALERAGQITIEFMRLVETRYGKRFPEKQEMAALVNR